MYGHKWPLLLDLCHKVFAQMDKGLSKCPSHPLSGGIKTFSFIKYFLIEYICMSHCCLVVKVIICDTYKLACEGNISIKSFFLRLGDHRLNWNLVP